MRATNGVLSRSLGQPLGLVAPLFDGLKKCKKSMLGIRGRDGTRWIRPAGETIARGPFGLQGRSAAQPTAALTAATTLSWSASLRYGCIGRLMTSREAFSDSGRSPQAEVPANTGCSCRHLG